MTRECPLLLKSMSNGQVQWTVINKKLQAFGSFFIFQVLLATLVIFYLALSTLTNPITSGHCPLQWTLSTFGKINVSKCPKSPELFQNVTLWASTWELLASRNLLLNLQSRTRTVKS